jgi:phosphomannomutase
MEQGAGKKIIALFDVDQTLSPARKSIQPEMVETLKAIEAKGVAVGIVSGSDLVKITEQLGPEIVKSSHFCFGENGLVAYKQGELLATMSIKDKVGDANLKSLINFVLRYIADLDIPIKRGTFIEYRNGMLNISPIGRNCSREERNEFEEYDKLSRVRKTMVEALQKEFAHLDLTYSIGGQISFDVFPKGWDKSFCLQYVEKEFDEMHFFGDKCYKGGNDHEIYEDSRTIGHEVANPDDTIKILKDLFLQ